MFISISKNTPKIKTYIVSNFLLTNIFFPKRQKNYKYS